MLRTACCARTWRGHEGSARWDVRRAGLGLLSSRVRDAFSKLDIIQFEDADPEAEDKRLGLA